MKRGTLVGMQSIQLRRINNKGKLTLRFVWDILSREDGPEKLLIETWGAKPKGYVKCFTSKASLARYIKARIAKSTAGSDGSDIDITLTGEDSYTVYNESVDMLENASRTSDAKVAKIRLNIGGVGSWDEESCLSKTICRALGCSEWRLTANELSQGIIRRVSNSIVNDRKNDWINSIGEAHQFFADEEFAVMDDVMGVGESIKHPIISAEDVRVMINAIDIKQVELEKINKEERTEDDLIAEAIDSAIERPLEWGGWA